MGQTLKESSTENIQILAAYFLRFNGLLLTASWRSAQIFKVSKLKFQSHNLLSYHEPLQHPLISP